MKAMDSDVPIKLALYVEQHVRFIGIRQFDAMKVKERDEEKLSVSADGKEASHSFCRSTS